MASASLITLPRVTEWVGRFNQPLGAARVSGSRGTTATELAAGLRATVDRALAQIRQAADAAEAVFDGQVELERAAADDGGVAPTLLAACRADARALWLSLCDWLPELEADAAALSSAGRWSFGPVARLRRAFAAGLDESAERARDLIRYLAISAPELDLTVPDHLARNVWTVRIPPLAYLRAMWSLWWSAIRHPLSETTIDLSTGRVLYRN